MAETLQPTGWDSNWIEIEAEMAGAHYGIYNEHGAADPFSMLSATGGQLIADDTLCAVVPLIIDSPNTYRIFMPRNTTFEHDRFYTALHIAVRTLHVLPNINRENLESIAITAQQRSGAILEEATWYAYSMLLPREEFIAAFDGTGGDVEQLGRIFEVSQLAVRQRCGHLSLTSENR